MNTPPKNATTTATLRYVEMTPAMPLPHTLMDEATMDSIIAHVLATSAWRASAEWGDLLLEPIAISLTLAGLYEPGDANLLD